MATGNDKGQVVGYGTVLTPLGFRHHAWLWSSGVMTDLGVPSAPGMPPSGAVALGAPKPGILLAPTKLANRYFHVAHPKALDITPSWI